MTPYYSRDGITIYCGDCLEVMPQLEGPFDLFFTSPPYNLGISSGGGLKGALKSGKWKLAELANGYENFDDAMLYPKYKEWQRNVLSTIWKALSDDGAIFYNHKPRIQNGELQIPLNFNPGLPIRQIIIWARAGGINFSTTHYVPTYEWIIIFAKKRFRLINKGSSGIGDVWNIPQEKNNPHPAPFPIELPLRAMITTPTFNICDPFMGSGTTLVAAQKLNRQATGIDISEEYCKITVDRLRQPSFFSLPSMQPKTEANQLGMFEEE